MAVFTLGDLLAVQARAAGVHAGSWPQAAWLVAICLLGARRACASEQRATEEAAGDRAARATVGTVIGLVTAAVAR